MFSAKCDYFNRCCARGRVLSLLSLSLTLLSSSSQLEQEEEEKKIAQLLSLSLLLLIAAADPPPETQLFVILKSRLQPPIHARPKNPRNFSVQNKRVWFDFGSSSCFLLLLLLLLLSCNLRRFALVWFGSLLLLPLPRRMVATRGREWVRSPAPRAICRVEIVARPDLRDVCSC